MNEVKERVSMTEQEQVLGQKILDRIMTILVDLGTPKFKKVAVDSGFGDRTHSIILDLNSSSLIITLHTQLGAVKS